MAGADFRSANRKNCLRQLATKLTFLYQLWGRQAAAFDSRFGHWEWRSPVTNNVMFPVAAILPATPPGDATARSGCRQRRCAYFISGSPVNLSACPPVHFPVRQLGSSLRSLRSTSLRPSQPRLFGSYPRNSERCARTWSFGSRISPPTRSSID